MKLRFLICLLVFIIQTNLQGGHIVGGYMYYENIELTGNGTSRLYKVNLKIYRECGSINNGQPVYIYTNDTLYTPINNFGVLPLELDSFNIVETPSSSCMTFPNDLCVQEMSYSAEIELPIIMDSYFLVLQKCCRAESIINIYDSENTGYTYMIEITPESQQQGNTSPIINDLTLSRFCINQQFNFPIEVTELDGDQLILKLCTPISDVSVSISDPPPPPPYPSVNFIAPEYTHLEPLGQTANLTLDPFTGALIGTPSNSGIFVVGVCVEEYRNGQLMSTIFRDFQFVVDVCIPHLNASMEAEYFPNEDFYKFQICKGESTDIQNLSTDTSHINNFYWIINMPTQTDTIFDWHPTLTFQEAGTYSGQLFLNPGEECSDTANLIVNVNTALEANFEVDYDTCIGGAVAYSDYSFSEGGEIVQWDWYFGDSTQSMETNPQHLYQQPGTKNTSLIITNEFECKDTVTKQFEWLPAPPILIIAPTKFEGCAPLSIFFENLSTPIDSTYDIQWRFGDGGFSSTISPEYIYEEVGNYDIEVSITSPIGCYIDTVFTSWIEVHEPPIANFDWMPRQLSNFSPEATFNNLSYNSVEQEWIFNSTDFFYHQEPSYVFADTGLQSVTLIVTDQFGCKDSLTQWVDVVPQVTYFLPNAFTPNEDSKNELYLGKGVLEGVTDFNMRIWNRWGELVFSTNDPLTGWDGRHFKTKKSIQEGVYICRVKYHNARGKLIELKQPLVLIR